MIFFEEFRQSSRKSFLLSILNYFALFFYPLVIILNIVVLYYSNYTDKNNSCGVACVLDVSIGALLLYCLPHDSKQEMNGMIEGNGDRKGMEEEKGDRQEEEGRKRKGKGKVDKKEQRERRQSPIGNNSKSPNKSRKQGKTNTSTSTAHTVQSVIPFCVIDIRWLLQLNEHRKNTTEVKNKEWDGEFRGASLWNERRNSLGINESKYEKGKKHVEWGAPSTTSKKEEVIDRVHFIACAMVVITKTYVTTRTVRQRMFSDIVRYSDSTIGSPRSPDSKSLNQQQNTLFSGQINGRLSDGVYRHDDSLRGFVGHNLRGDEGGGEEDVKEDTRLCAGTVYIVNLQGE